MNLSPFIQKLPKAELHLHIEGTLEPELIFELATLNNLPTPFNSPDEARASYRFSNLEEFLEVYYRSMSVLRTGKDFYELTTAYLKRAAAQSVRHAEIFFDPQAHTSRGVDFADMVEGIDRGLRYGEGKYGITSRLIMCFLRHLDEQDAMATLAQAIPFRDRIFGVGLDSTESGNPPGKFKGVFDKAREAGFRCVAHAGEEGPAAYVREAVEALQVERIDHGCRVLEDPELTRELAERAVPFTVCPLSNVRLGVVDSLEEHPLRLMLDAGLTVTLNSDDPAYFGGYVAQNFQAVQDYLAMDDRTLGELARNSFRASFLDDGKKAELLAEVDAYMDAR